MMSMRKHVDWLKSLDRSFSLYKQIKISGECYWITRNVDELKFMIFFNCVEKFTDILVKSFSWRIYDDQSYIFQFRGDMMVVFE